MGKRASVASHPKKGAKAAKGRKDVAAAQEADPIVEACEPILECIGELQDVPEVVAEILSVTLPVALSKPKTERHPYEASVVDTAVNIFDDSDAKLKAEVAEAEAAGAQVATEIAAITTEIEAAVACAAEKKETSSTAEAAHAAACDAASSAKEAVDAAKAAVESLANEQAAVVASREECEAALARLWVPLKANEYKGNEWRVRDKSISELMRLLQKWCDVPESLSSALPIALKTKTSERGEFALQTLEAGEAMHNEHLTELSAKIADFDDESARRAATVSTAESALAEADAAKEKAMAESNMRQNEWAEAQSAVDEAKRREKDLGNKELDATRDVAAAHGAMEDLREVSEKLVALRDALPDEPDAAKANEPSGEVEDAAMQEATEAEAPSAAAAEE